MYRANNCLCANNHDLQTAIPSYTLVGIEETLRILQRIFHYLVAN